MRTQFNWGKITKAKSKAFREVNFLLGRNFTEAISSPSWDYPIDPRTRDIVDTGRLRASQQLIFSPDGTEAIHSWPVEYAIYVHEGYTTRAGTEIPARKWTEEGMKKLDLEQTFKTLLNREI